MLLCPSTPTQGDIETRPGGGAGHIAGSAAVPYRYTSSPRVEGSYGMNGYLYSTYTASGSHDDYGNPSGNASSLYRPSGWVNLAPKIRQPGDTPMFADSVWIDGWPSHFDALPPDFEGLGGTRDDSNHMLRFAVDRHGPPGQALQNVGFLDGHAEAVSTEDLWILRWNNLYQ